MKYWLFKSEADVYSIDDLKRDRVTFWDGIRNYQARNFLRDQIKKGDQVFFYHSNSEPLAIVGICEVVKEGYPESDPQKPTWFMVDVKFVKKFKNPITRDILQKNKITQKMMLLQKGSRLSIQPVTKEEWESVLKLE